MRILLAATAVVLATIPAACDVDFAGAPIVVGPDATTMEITAAREFQRYGRLLCGRQARVLQRAAPPTRGTAVLIGTPKSLPQLAAHAPHDLAADGYVLKVTRSPDRLIIAGRTPVGVQNGVYSALERLGVGFYLGGDALPPTRSALALPDGLDERREPVFRIRGSLPWINFLNSPTTWNLEDYRYFFDQMAKMKMNFVGFHAYDHEPFFAFEDGGEWRYGEPVVTSRNYGWGTVRGLLTAEFGFGTDRYFDEPEFGSRATTGMADRGDGILRAQCVMAQGLQYAAERGIHTCVGFEIHGDPTDPANQLIQEKRIRHTLSRFPMADYIWFWQAEGLGGGSALPTRGSQLGALVDYYRNVFEYLGSEERIAEAVRVAVMVQFAHRTVRAVRPDIGVIVSGWGGDQWMRFSDFYVGLDKVLPKDVIFSALDNIDPTASPKVSHAYGEVSRSRQRWPIPWYESDGGGTRRDQWGPQANVRPFTALCRDALDKQCQGLLGIHWQTRGVEEVVAYVAQFAWDPELTYERFYDGFAQRCFGDDLGPEMSQVLQDLEALGPRWTGAPGQVECGTFSWFSDSRRPLPQNLAKLAEIREKLAAYEARHTANDRLRYLIATIDFVTAYDRAALRLSPEGDIAQGVLRAEALAEQGRAEEARELAASLWPELQACGLDEAMEVYADRLSTQGDYGNLATINVKAYASWTMLRDRLAVVSPEPIRTLIPEPLRPPTISCKLQAGAVPEGVPIPVRCTAFSQGSPVTLVLHYRAPGESWEQVPMVRTFRCGYAAEVPGAAVTARGVEYYIEARDAEGRSALMPPTAPDRPFTATATPYAGPVVYPPVGVRQSAYALPAKGQPLGLAAIALSPVEYDHIDGALHASGAQGPSTTTYHVIRQYLGEQTGSVVARATARDSVGLTATSAEVTLVPDVEPPPAVSELSADTSRPFRVALSWVHPGPAGDVYRYEVHRSDAGQFTPSADTLLAETPLELYIDTGCPVGATQTYAVVPVDEYGNRGPARVTATVHIASPPLLPAPEGLVADGRPGKIVLAWSPMASQDLIGYAVYEFQQGAWVPVGPAEPIPSPSLIIAPSDPELVRTFRVAAVDLAGREGAPSAEAAAAALPAPVDPVFATTFDSPTASTGQQGTLMDGARLTGGALNTEAGGWIEYGGEPALQLGGPLSLDLWFRPTSLEGMPLLVSFGQWGGDGYWIQYLGGQVRFYLGHMQVLDAGTLRIGEWAHIAAVYDGARQMLYVNGVEVGRRPVPVVSVQPWHGPLRIGHYSIIASEYQSRGLIDDVRIFQRALSPEEVRAAYEAGRRSGR